MKLIPIYDETAPITCTIGHDEVSDRIELVERMRANLRTIERTQFGLLLHFPERADIGADLRTFAVDEKQCCQFWGFDVDSANGELTLLWDGPPSATELLDRLHGYFLGDEPLTTISGLL